MVSWDAVTKQAAPNHELQNLVDMGGGMHAEPGGF